MSIPINIKSKLINALKIYDDDKYSESYKRKAYNDDNVLFEERVLIKDLIIAFQLYNKKKYEEFFSEVNGKNNFETIEKLKANKHNFKQFTLDYVLNNYDYGYEKYNRLQIQEIEVTYKYDVENEQYKKYSYMMGGKLINYNMTYMDLLDDTDTYNTIKKVVNKIKQLEEK